MTILNYLSLKGLRHTFLFFNSRRRKRNLSGYPGIVLSLGMILFPDLAASIGYALNATIIFLLSSSARRQVAMEQRRIYARFAVNNILTRLVVFSLQYFNVPGCLQLTIFQRYWPCRVESAEAPIESILH